MPGCRTCRVGRPPRQLAVVARYETRPEGISTPARLQVRMEVVIEQDGANISEARLALAAVSG